MTKQFSCSNIISEPCYILIFIFSIGTPMSYPQREMWLNIDNKYILISATIMSSVVKSPLNEWFFKRNDNCLEFKVIKSKQAGSISECGILCKSYNSGLWCVFSFHTSTCDLVSDNAVRSVIKTVCKIFISSC